MSNKFEIDFYEAAQKKSEVGEPSIAEHVCPTLHSTRVILEELKSLAASWETKQYPSDEIRWKSYSDDVLKLIGKYDPSIEIVNKPYEGV